MLGRPAEADMVLVPALVLQQLDSPQHFGGHVSLVPLHTSLTVWQQSTGESFSVSPSLHTPSYAVAFGVMPCSYCFLQRSSKQSENFQQSPGIWYNILKPERHLFRTCSCPVQPPHEKLCLFSPSPALLSLPHGSQYTPKEAL